MEKNWKRAKALNIVKRDLADLKLDLEIEFKCDEEIKPTFPLDREEEEEESNELEELIRKWHILDIRANRVLKEHMSFLQYNSIRKQMDYVEEELFNKYGLTQKEYEDK